ncbi:MAG: iron-sulfur cluster assembly scaffold protein [Spirochaetales bacterium]|nr:iron-sulfur cluster assembly scaffold protein [Spirochaetales bacterium]
MSEDFNWMYSEVVKDHFINPRNVLGDENAFAADGKGVVGNIKCGDQMLIVIKVNDGIISDCKWKTYGCASAIASTSILSQAVIGMTLEEAYHVKPKDIADRLGGLPEHKIHCSVLGDKALRAAIEDYYRKTGREERIEEEETRIICQCMNVTDRDIEEAVRNGARNYADLQNMTKAGTVCGQCRKESEELIHQYVHMYVE